MIEVCSYCNKIIKNPDNLDPAKINPAKISHGACDDCFTIEMQKIEDMFKQDVAAMN